MNSDTRLRATSSGTQNFNGECDGTAANRANESRVGADWFQIRAAKCLFRRSKHCGEDDATLRVENAPVVVDVSRQVRGRVTGIAGIGVDGAHGVEETHNLRPYSAVTPVCDVRRCDV